MLNDYMIYKGPFEQTKNLSEEWCVIVCKTMQLISGKSMTWNICVDIDSRKENGILWIIDIVSKIFCIVFCVFLGELLFHQMLC